MHGRTHARLVIWPRGEKANVSEDEPTPEGAPKILYRYMVTGLLITEHPIMSLEGVNETVIDGDGSKLAVFLEESDQRSPKIRLGDASSVYHSMDIL